MVRDGRTLDVLVRRNGSAIEVSPGNRPIRVAVSSPWAARNAAAKDSVEDPSRIRARMPGRVIRVLKRDGDPVGIGEGLAVIEAMKMQNELKSACSGVIARCRITEGQAVVSGDLLFEITEAPVRP
jgi:biotin carboxyl carrier protein